MDKKYLIFAATGVGLGHLMSGILDSAFYAYRTGRVFAMDMREVIFFGGDNHEAFFQNFEVQLPADMEVITDLAEIEALKREPDLHFLTLSTPLDIDRPFPNKVVLVPCITPGNPFKPSRRREDQIFRIDPKAQLAEAVSRAMGLPYWKKRVIGVHYRATVGELFERMTKLTVPDYDERYQVVKDNYVTTALKLVEGQDPDSYAFLIASDDREFVSEMKQRLPNAFSIGTLRLDQEFMAYMKANKHDLAILVDAVSDLWALSRCEHLLHSRSAFTHFAIMNSPHLADQNTHYIHMPLFDEILASLPPDTAVDWARAAVRKIDISRMHFEKMHRFLVDALERVGKLDEAAYVRQQADWHEEAAQSPEIDGADVFAERAEQREGKQDLALARARRAVARLPENPYLRGGFGGSLSSLLLFHGQPDEAVQEARRAVALDPKDAFLHDHLGEVLVRLGKHVEAEQTFREAITIAPGVSSFHLHHGYSLARLGRLPEAVAAMNGAVVLDPTSAQAYTAIGDISMHAKRYAEAEQAFRNAGALNKNDIGVQHRLSVAMERQGRYQEALEIVRAIALKEPKNPDRPRRIADLLGMIGDAPGVEAALREALAAHPGDGHLHRALVNHLTTQGRKEALIEALEAACRAVPDDAAFHSRYGTMMLSLERFLEAEVSLRRSLELNTQDIGTQHLQSIALERQGKFHDAIVTAVAASKLEPQNQDRIDRILALARRLATERVLA